MKCLDWTAVIFVYFNFNSFIPIKAKFVAAEIYMSTTLSSMAIAPPITSNPCSSQSSNEKAADIVLTSGKIRDLDEAPIQSPNKKVSLKFDSLHNLIIVRKCDNNVLWTQVASRSGLGERVAMKLDGNFVVYGPFDHRATWETGTAGNPGAVLRMQDDGFLCVDKNGSCIWSNGQHFNSSCGTAIFSPTDTEPSEADIILPSGANKDPEDVTVMLKSPNNKVILRFNSNQDLVVMKQCDDTVLWKQVIAGLGKRVAMEPSGNFVVYGYGPGQYMAWESKTSGNPGADLRLQDDGHLCVYKHGRGCIWSNEKRFDASCNDTDDDMSDGKTVLLSGQRMTFTENETTFWSQDGSVGIKIKKQDGLEKLSVFRKCDNEALWSPGLGRPFRSTDSVKLIMQRDGNLVIYGTDEDELTGKNAFWAIGHHRHYTGAILKLQNDGLLCVWKNGVCLWNSRKRFRNTDCVATVTNLTDQGKTVLESGHKLQFGDDQILSRNGSVGIAVARNGKTDGLSVFRKCDGKVLWSADLWRNMSSAESFRVIMQRDGSLVIYGSDSDEQSGRNAYWSWRDQSGIWHDRDMDSEGAVLKLYDDGKLCISKDDECIWSSTEDYPELGEVQCSGALRRATPQSAIWVGITLFCLLRQ